MGHGFEMAQKGWNGEFVHGSPSPSWFGAKLWRGARASGIAAAARPRPPCHAHTCRPPPAKLPPPTFLADISEIEDTDFAQNLFLQSLKFIAANWALIQWRPIWVAAAWFGHRERERAATTQQPASCHSHTILSVPCHQCWEGCAICSDFEKLKDLQKYFADLEASFLPPKGSAVHLFPRYKLYNTSDGSAEK